MNTMVALIFIILVVILFTRLRRRPADQRYRKSKAFGRRGPPAKQKMKVHAPVYNAQGEMICDGWCDDPDLHEDVVRKQRAHRLK